MTGLALAGTLAMLTIYVTFFVVVLPHVADRYSPRFMPLILRQIAFWPLVTLGVLAAGTGVLAVLPSDHSWTVSGVRGWDLLALVALILSVAVGLIASYQMWSQVADGAGLIAWLHKRGGLARRDALDEVLWNALQRSDRATTAAALKLGLGQGERYGLVQWLIDHRELLATDWATREVLVLLLHDGLEQHDADSRMEFLCALLVDALNAEVYHRAIWIVDGVLSALADATPWTESHAYLYYQLGFALWHIEESGTAIPRGARIPSQLEQVQAEFVIKTPPVWRHVLSSGEAEGVEWFTMYLGLLASDTPDDGLLSRVHGVMEDAFPKGLLRLRTIHELASDLNYARRVKLDDTDRSARIDRYVVTLAAMAAELGETREGVWALLGNGGLAQRRPDSVSCELWMKQTSYNAVFALLGIGRP